MGRWRWWWRRCRAPQIFLEWHTATTIIGLSLPIQGLQDGPLALAVAALPRLKTLNVGHTAAGDATLGALTYAHRASAWAKEYGATLVIRILFYSPVTTQSVIQASSR